MIRCRLPLPFLMIALFLLPARADDDVDSAPLPPAARRILEDAEKAIAKNRKAFDAANDESLDEAEKALKEVMEKLTKDGKLEEALATKKLLATFREQVGGSADGASKRKATDALKRKPVAKPAARGGKLECDELFGFADEKKVNEWWEFNEKAQNHQIGTEGLRLNNGGNMRLRVGLVGDFEIGVVVQHHTHHDVAVLQLAGSTLDIGGQEHGPGTIFRLGVVRKGDQMLVNNNGKQSVITIPAAQVDKPQYPSISFPNKLDVKTVGIKAVKIVRP